MTTLFSTPKVKDPQPAPPPPKESDKPVQEASAEARARRQRARGHRSTRIATNDTGGGAGTSPATETTLGA